MPKIILNEYEEKFRKIFLNVGCGKLPEEGGMPNEEIHGIFQTENWVQVRVDSDPEAKPDVIADMVTLEGVKEYCEHPIHGIFSSHSFEHLHPYDASKALNRWRTILAPGGRLIIQCPDIQAACQAIGKGRGNSVMYVSPAGPITAMDMVFGYVHFTHSREGMLHRWGWTRDSLEDALLRVGFSSVSVTQDYRNYNLTGYAVK